MAARRGRPPKQQPAELDAWAEGEERSEARELRGFEPMERTDTGRNLTREFLAQYTGSEERAREIVPDD